LTRNPQKKGKGRKEEKKKEIQSLGQFCLNEMQLGLISEHEIGKDNDPDQGRRKSRSKLTIRKQNRQRKGGSS
jgi:hypothetical protein